MRKGAEYSEKLADIYQTVILIFKVNFKETNV